MFVNNPNKKQIISSDNYLFQISQKFMYIRTYLLPYAHFYRIFNVMNQLKSFLKPLSINFIKV